MKPKSKLQSYTLDELIAQRKKTTGAAIGLGIVALIAFAILLYVGITTKKPAFTAIALCLVGPMTPLWVYLGQINGEIKSRTAK